MSRDRGGFDTRAIHAGGEGVNPERALCPPIFMTSSFTFDDLAAADDVMSFRSDDYVYTRGNNPTLRLFENRMAALEGGSGAVAFASGMAAISSTLLSLLKPGDEVVAHRTLYGSAHSFISTLLPRYGMACRFVDLSDPLALESAIGERTRALYFETPSNPNLEIVDIRSVCAAAAAHGVKVVVDNTFATPYLQRPLELGADVVVHSATKYICGHGDSVAGVAVARDAEYVQTLKFGYMCELGGVLSPFNAWLLLRGLKTLGLRMRQHCANAERVASFLAAHPKVERVYYPGLEGSPGRDTATAQMSGFGAIVSFEVRGGLAAASRAVDASEMFPIAVSLGDCETLIQLPAAMTHRGYDRERLAEFGLTESMVRLSVGIEDADDIIAELDRMLAEA